MWLHWMTWKEEQLYLIRIIIIVKVLYTAASLQNVSRTARQRFVKTAAQAWISQDIWTSSSHSDQNVTWFCSKHWFSHRSVTLKVYHMSNLCTEVRITVKNDYTGLCYVPGFSNSSTVCNFQESSSCCMRLRKNHTEHPGSKPAASHRYTQEG